MNEYKEEIIKVIKENRTTIDDWYQWEKEKVRNIIIKHSRNDGECVPDYNYEKLVEDIVGFYDRYSS